MEKMHPFERIIITAVFIAVIAGLVLSYASPDLFDEGYVTEDGPIEWFTVPALLTGMVVCFRRVILLRSRRKALFLAITFLLGVLFLFGAGEEISWGQRIVGFRSPEWFQEHNTQRDATIHNIQVGDVKINKLVFSQGIGLVLVVYVLILPLLYRISARAARLIDALAIPLPRPRHVIAVLALLVISYGLVHSSYRGELAECGLSWMVTLAFMFPLNAATFR